MSTAPIPESVKQKVAEMLVDNFRPKEIHEELGISYSSISRIKSQIPPELLGRIKQEDAEVIMSLVTQQLTTNIEATIAIAEQAKDENWRKEQGADKLAAFHKAISADTIRLLEASEAAAAANQGYGAIQENKGEFEN